MLRDYFQRYEPTVLMGLSLVLFKFSLCITFINSFFIDLTNHVRVPSMCLESESSLSWKLWEKWFPLPLIELLNLPSHSSPISCLWGNWRVLWSIILNWFQVLLESLCSNHMGGFGGLGVANKIVEWVGLNFTVYWYSFTLNRFSHDIHKAVSVRGSMK